MAVSEPWPASSLAGTSTPDHHYEDVVLREDDILNLVDRVASGRNAWEELYNSATAAREKREAVKLHGRYIMERIDASLSFTPRTGRAPKYSTDRPPYWERLTATGGSHTSNSFGSPVTPRELFSRSTSARTPRTPVVNHRSVSSKQIDSKKVVMRLQSPSTRKRTPSRPVQEPTYVPQLRPKTLELTRNRALQHKQDGGIHEVLHQQASEIASNKKSTEKSGNNSRGRQVGEIKDLQEKPTLSEGTRMIIDRKKKEVDYDSMTGRKGPVRRKKAESPKRAPSPPDEMADTISVSIQGSQINSTVVSSDGSDDVDDTDDDDDESDDDTDSDEYHSTSDNDDTDTRTESPYMSSQGTPRSHPIGSHVICATANGPVLGFITHHNDDGYAYRISTKAGQLGAKLESYVKPAGKKVYVNTVAACGGGFGITCVDTRVTGMSPYSAANGTIPMGSTITAVNDTVVETEEDLIRVLSALNGTPKATAFFIIPATDTQWKNVPVKAAVGGPQQPVIEGRQKTLPMNRTQSPGGAVKGRNKEASPPGVHPYKKSPGLSPYKGGSISTMSQGSGQPAWSAKGPPPGPPAPVQGSVKGGRAPSPVVQHRPGRPRSMDESPESTPRPQGGLKGAPPPGSSHRPSPIMKPKKKVPRPRLRPQ